MYFFSSQVKFQPYVGKQYGTDSDFKMPLLILGKMHYCVIKDPAHECFIECDNIKFTTSVMDLHVRQVCKQGYLASIAKAIRGEEIGSGSKDTFWNSVAFYNYIQTMRDTPSHAPTQSMWREAMSPFEEVVLKLKPACILVIGKPLLRRIAIQHPGNIEYAGKVIETGTFLSTPIGAIDTPPFGFSPPAWNPVILKFLDAAMGQQ